MREKKLHDLDRIKFYAAEYVWPIRDEQTPSGEREQKQGGPGLTWAQWFGRKFGEPLEVYARRAKAEGIRKRIARRDE